MHTGMLSLGDFIASDQSKMGVYQPLQNRERDAKQRDGSVRLGSLVQVYLVLGGPRR